MSLESSAQPRLPFESSDSLQADTSDKYNEIHPSMEIVPCNSKGKSTSESEHILTTKLPVHHTELSEDLIGPANSVGTRINIRRRTSESRSFSSSLSCPPKPPGQQGIAERRIRLQSLKSVERMCRRVSHVNMTQLESTGTSEVSFSV